MGSTNPDFFFFLCMQTEIVERASYELSPWWGKCLQTVESPRWRKFSVGFDLATTTWNALFFPFCDVCLYEPLKCYGPLWNSFLLSLGFSLTWLVLSMISKWWPKIRVFISMVWWSLTLCTNLVWQCSDPNIFGETCRWAFRQVGKGMFE